MMLLKIYYIFMKMMMMMMTASIENGSSIEKAMVSDCPGPSP
jgi:hypothetical protein